MRKIYSIFMLAVMALVMSFTAKAATITINVDDPSRVEVQVNWETKTLVAGDNVFELNLNSTNYVYILPAQGALLKSVTNAEGTPQSISGGQCYLYEYPTKAEYASKYIVKSLSIAEARTASCTINVDNVDNIGGLQASGTDERYTLVNGENTVKFIPDMESPLVLSAPYGKTFYKVVVDNVEVAEDWSTWYLYVVDGSVVDIQTEFPDVEVAVNIAYATEEANGIVAAIYVDGEEATPDADGNIMVKLGKTIELNLDNVNYQIDSFTINGETPSDWYGSPYYSFTVLEAANIVVGGHKYGTFTYTINIEHPECVVVEDYNYNVLNLVAGENVFSVSENQASISITKAAGCKITSVLVNGVEASDYGYDSSWGTTINIPSDGTVIDIFAEEIVYDYHATIEIDGPCYSYSSITPQSTQESFYLKEGINNYGFNAGSEYNSIYVMTPGWNAPAAMYHNSIFLTQYSRANLTLADGDYIKVFMTERPEESVVTFEKIAFTGDNVTVTVDGKVVTNWEAGFTVLKGTEISVTGAQVIVNDTVVNGDGTYTFTADGAETKVVLCDNAVGIEEIGADANAVEYYNLQGVKVENPEKGIFIKKQGGRATKVVL